MSVKSFSGSGFNPAPTMTQTEATTGTETTARLITPKVLADTVATRLAASGSVKSVQRGIASAAGTITISAVVMAKAFVISESKGSAGSVAARGTIAASSINSGTLSGSITGTLSGKIYPDYTGAGNVHYNPNTWYNGSKGTTYHSTAELAGTRTLSGSMSGTVASAAISGGTTDLTVKQYSARLTSATQLTLDGPCWWQVVEFN